MHTLQLSTFFVAELKTGGLYHNLITALWNLVNLSKCINGSLNFPIYCIMGSKFRVTLKEVVTCGKAKVTEKTKGKVASNQSNTLSN